jgi:large subunit ribosomal protein L22
MKTKNIVARASFLHDSPRKLRLVADAVRGLAPDAAINALKFIPKRASKILIKVFQQGIANAKNNFQISPGNLVVESLQIEEGPRGPKRMDKSHGARFDRGIKRRRMAHILLKLSTKEDKHGA